MAGFGWAGAAAGVSDALRQQRQEQADAANADLRRQALLAQLTSQEDARAERQEQRRFENARITAGLLTPGAEVTSEQGAYLKGTPYGDALLEQRSSLPSRTGFLSPLGGVQAGAADAGGRQFDVFLGTPAQREEAAQRQRLDALLRDPSTPPMVGRLVAFREAGIPIANPESLMTDAERAARQPRGSATARPVRVDTVDDNGAPITKFLSPEDIEGQTFRRPATARRVPTGRLVKRDDAAFPAGVQSYLADMKRRGYTRRQAEGEVFKVWEQLRADHPTLDVTRVQRAISQLFPADALGGGLDSGGDDAAVPGAPSAGAGSAEGSRPGQGQSATRAEVQELAKRKGLSAVDVQRQLEALGVRVQ